MNLIYKRVNTTFGNSNFSFCSPSKAQWCTFQKVILSASLFGIPSLWLPECIWFQRADVRYLVFGSQKLRLSKQLATREYIWNAWKSGRYCVASVSWFLSMLGVFIDGIYGCLLLFSQLSCCSWNGSVANKTWIHASWCVVTAGIIFLIIRGRVQIWSAQLDLIISQVYLNLVIQGSALAFLTFRTAYEIWGPLKSVPNFPFTSAGQGQMCGACFRYWLNLKLFEESCPAC